MLIPGRSHSSRARTQTQGCLTTELFTLPVSLSLPKPNSKECVLNTWEEQTNGLIEPVGIPLHTDCRKMNVHRIPEGDLESWGLSSNHSGPHKLNQAAEV